MQRLHQLYRILDKARAKRGAIEFETSEVRFVLGPQGEVTQAGMIGRITKLDDNNVTVEVAKNVEIQFQRAAIGNKLEKGSYKG